MGNVQIMTMTLKSPQILKNIWANMRRLACMQQAIGLYFDLFNTGLNVEWFNLLYSSTADIRNCPYNQYSGLIDLNLLEINKYCHEQSSLRETETPDFKQTFRKHISYEISWEKEFF